MFVFSFKASSFKIICVLCACVIAVSVAVTLMPDVGSSLNVNKIEAVKELEKISVKNDKGRIEYLSALGYGVEKEPVSTSSEMLPKVFDAVMERYNDLQRLQGFDLSKCSGKKVTGYTYKVITFPDGTSPSDGAYYATLICYKNKVVAADLCCVEKGLYSPLVKAA